MILASAVLSQYTRVTDDRETTDKETDDRRHVMAIAKLAICNVPLKTHFSIALNVRNHFWKQHKKSDYNDNVTYGTLDVSIEARASTDSFLSTALTTLSDASSQ